CNNTQYRLYGSTEQETEKKSFYTYLSVCTTNGITFTAVKSKNCSDNQKQVALGRYRNAVNETGWGILEIETFAGNYSYDTQAFAAGLAEGLLTRKQIYYHFQNTLEDLCTENDDYCKKLYKHLNKNLQFIREKVKSNNIQSENRYWNQVKLIFYQLTGMYYGFAEDGDYKRSISFNNNLIYLLQISGELFDLNKYLNKTKDLNEDPDPGHCTGLFKIAPGNKDLYFSHVAMNGYNTMNRVLKLYTFDFDPRKVPGHQIAMSSYPASLTSVDDYIMTSAGLGSTETTISIFNTTLYNDQYMTPNSLHCWIRSVIASRLASSAKEWVEIFAKYNSGTYNNQWSVVDYKLFTPGKELPDADVAWVLEQVPGYTVYDDVTWFLKQYQYWPSYNIPFFKFISDISGYTTEAEKTFWRSWKECPRAKIMKRDQHKVANMDDLAKFMRYNDYKHDPFSRCKCIPPYTAEAAMSARGDLNPAGGVYELDGMGHRNHGGIDYKGTDYKMFKQLRFVAWGGPTYDTNCLYAVCWLTTDIKAKHYGQPDVWDFKPMTTNWETDIKTVL
uniref:Phospholipase B-like n=1 Tax=Syphacia muris TaxID=451379 RepID=A0A0N5AL28_9BILA